VEIGLDRLIDEINKSQKSIISVYLFGEMGIGAPRFIQDKPHVLRNEEGYAFFPIAGEDEETAGYYIGDLHEIYEEEADEEARAKFEVREQGILLMEIRLY